MSEAILLVVSCALLGSFVGFLAGLLGIGGGLVIVPVLSGILRYFNIVPESQIVLVAIATSLASILFTSTSSALAHHRNGNVPWNIAPYVMGGVAFGALISGFLAALLPEPVIRSIFAVSVVLIAIKMLYSSSKKSVTQRALPSGPVLGALTCVMGGLSAMIGIGGGALIVPLLSFFSMDMRKAIGSASACGIVIALFGSLGYITAGSAHYTFSQGFAGFIYLPALFGIVLTSWFMAPLGAKSTQFLPVSTIKKIFAALLLVIAINMIIS
ncbi:MULTISPECIES: sulfite exporter TauE/SafE family protein [Pseudoalteromonas]|uniref:Probable membrane transporter protein n=1 Tax=Pseudoalteromonas amylolytica TaxID=1859457 RepID=A0A1S1MYV8_9GAMM|nr:MULTISPECIES: sulfite exporter TauE/SafE family protein [Pseudoalteromonas]MCF6434647.1 sulfite exporter TauE/SafE family protein [Pseudoalteromonas sp. MMG022]OHU87523.1 permease [Pseudoalteromonas sp. JW3]OHU90966.1 permease [Pseudoalteromonas amylolytica]